MLKKRIAAALGAALLAATVTACGSGADAPKAQTDAPKEQTYDHVWGQTKVNGVPQKPVALEYSFLDAMLAIGVQPSGLAGSGTNDVLKYLRSQTTGDITYVGDRNQPNLDLIRSMKPDIIFAYPGRQEKIKEDLKQIGPTIALGDASYKQVLDNTKMIGKIFGKEKEADQVAKALEEKIAAQKAKNTGNASVLVVKPNDDIDLERNPGKEKGFNVWVKDSFIGTLLTGIGAKYAYSGEKDPKETTEIASLTIGKITEINPDYIFVYGNNDFVKNYPTFKDLKAAKDGHVYNVDREVWSRGRGPLAAGLIIDEAMGYFAAKK